MRLVVGFALVLSGGCMLDADRPPPPTGGGAGDLRAGPVAAAAPVPDNLDGWVVQDGFLSGDMGSVICLSAPVVQALVEDYRGEVTITLVAIESRRAMMAMPVLTHRQLTPGTTSSISYGLGCSGPVGVPWVFDRPADRKRVVVSEGAAPGAIHVDFTFEFDLPVRGGGGTPQITTGSFDIVRP